MHDPNPFDFVPFQDAPLLFTPEEFDQMGVKLSGYLEVKLSTLTPIHIVGSLRHEADASHSTMYQQDGAYCIPASTVRGCLRSFVEALTSGWVSQATPDYPKDYKKRHIGFSAFDLHTNKGQSLTRLSPPAISPDFMPQQRPDGKIDVASYFFGIVSEAKTASDEILARKSKVWIEDAFVSSKHIVKNYWLPDISGEAFMGGAKPNASNWWYLQPAEIWKRHVGKLEVAEFVGTKFWGRKFYYHQDPSNCIRFYDPNGGQWEYSNERDFRKVNLECMDANESTDNFRIYFDRTPEPLVRLLILALMPGNNIRHKLGYGKAYGYGSIEFKIVSAHLRSENATSRIPLDLQSYASQIDGWNADGWQLEKLTEAGVDKLVDRNALTALARILGWQEANRIRYTYPPFGRGGFQPPIQYSDLVRLLPRDIPVGNTIQVNSQDAWNIAKALFGIKRAIHFRYYQEQANGWNIIERRKP